MKTIEIVGENYCGNWDKTRTIMAQLSRQKFDVFIMN